MDIYQVFAFVGGVLVIFAAIPQVFRILKHKSAKDVSLPMFTLLFTANILWFLYGLHLGDKALIFTNFFAGLIALTNMVLIIRYEYGKSTH